MAGLDAGDLDREIRLEWATFSKNPETGQEVETWVPDEEKTWAQWLPGSPSETWHARQIEASIDGVYLIYDMSPRPTPETVRIIGHDGRYFDVKGVTEKDRGDGLLISVVARAERV